MKKIFKNKLYTKRNYEATNIIYCEAYDAPSDIWEEIKENVPANMTDLFTQNNVKYYGFL